MLSKKIMVPIFAVTLTTAALFGANQLVHAQGNGNSQTLVQMIAQKFGLDQSKVQSVFDEYKLNQVNKRQAQMKTKLDQLVSQGKITATQEQAILDEFAKLKSEYNPASFKNMTRAQRQQQFANMQQELKSWAAQQGIDLSILPMGRGMGMHHSEGNEQNPTATPTP